MTFEGAYYLLDANCPHLCEGCFLEPQRKYALRDFNTATKDIKQLLNDEIKVRVTGSNIVKYPKIETILSLCKQDYILADIFTVQQDKALLEMLPNFGVKVAFITSPYSSNVNNKFAISEASETIKSAGLELAISYIISPFNKNKIPEMIAEAKSVSANSIRFMRYLPTTLNQSDLNLSREEERKVIEEVSNVREKIPKEQLQIYIHGHFGTKFRPSKGPICFAGERMFFIGLDDIVYPCEFLSSPEFAIGRFKNSRIQLEKKLCGYKNDECKLLQMYDSKNE